MEEHSIDQIISSILTIEQSLQKRERQELNQTIINIGAVVTRSED